MPDGARAGFLPTSLRAAVPASDFGDSLIIIISGNPQQTGPGFRQVTFRTVPYENQAELMILGFRGQVTIRTVPRGTVRIVTWPRNPKIINSAWFS